MITARLHSGSPVNRTSISSPTTIPNPPSTTPTPATKSAVCHQRPRTRSELRRSALVPSTPFEHHRLGGELVTDQPMDGPRDSDHGEIEDDDHRDGSSERAAEVAATRHHRAERVAGSRRLASGRAVENSRNRGVGKEERDRARQAADEQRDQQPTRATRIGRGHELTDPRQPGDQCADHARERRERDVHESDRGKRQRGGAGSARTRCGRSAPARRGWTTGRSATELHDVRRTTNTAMDEEHARG